jgi:predicted deacylase
VRLRVYVQAGLHADETPGMAVPHALMVQLADLESGSEIAGEIVVAPIANPPGFRSQ